MEEEKGIIEVGWNLENSYAELPKCFFTKQKPTPVCLPKLITLNYPLATSLGFNPMSLQNSDSLEIFAGNKLPEGSNPIAQAYAGHQFGYFNMLGDGRAILLGEQINAKEEKYDIQLKGSGITPYSRGGDGRAALKPMLREYIISEAMHALRIATTRSLAVVTTGESVIREKILPGAILIRVADSHIRVATFQYAAEYCSLDELRALADYTLKRHFSDYKEHEDKYLFLLKQVIKRQASLIAKWQLVGFIHGVMNTDNMAISGETIDYGPCAFMDTYDPKTVFSSIDREGRYAYGNQPRMGGWNLARFAETLIPLLHDNQDKAVEIAQNAVSDYAELYQKHWLDGMRAKLGIFNEEESDKELIEELLSMMHKYSADYTNTFSALTFGYFSDMELFKTEEFNSWYARWKERLGRQDESKDSSHEFMESSNPVIIPRNYRVEEALDAAEKGDYSVMQEFLNVLSSPYEYPGDYRGYNKPPEKSDIPYRTFCGT